MEARKAERTAAQEQNAREIEAVRNAGQVRDCSDKTKVRDCSDKTKAGKPIDLDDLIMN